MNNMLYDTSKILSVVIILILSSHKIYSNDYIIKSDKEIIYVKDSLKIKIEFITPSIVHIQSSPSEFSSINSLIIDDTDQPNPVYSIEEFENEIIVRTDSLSVRINRGDANLEFYKDGQLIVKESDRQYTERLLDDEKVFKIKQTFQLSKNEALYGLGQHQNGVLNYRNNSIELVQDNSEVAIPFVVSTNNYGILWDNYSRTKFSDDENGMSFQSDIADQIDYYFIYGNKFDDIIKQYRKLTGEAPLLPKWAYGYFQSRNRYWTQKELLNTVQKFRRLSIPMDVIVLDYLHWGKYGFGSFKFDEPSFPNPGKMIDSLHNIYNCRIMVSVWPSFSKNTPNWEIMNSNKYLLEVNSYENTQVYDAYNPSAAKLYWSLLEQTYGKLGVDGWWLDATEPEKMSEYSKSINYLGSSERYLNSYSLVDARNVYEGQRNSTSQKRVFILTRSSFAGQQKYSSATWSGDIGTTFQTLKAQIPAGLNFCMSGVPYWTSDIGGYKGGDPDDTKYRELYIRWFQYGTFCPIFRSHGRRAPGDRKTPNEIWSYGNEAQSILIKYLKLRYRLLPYIYSAAWQTTNNGGTIMRALSFDFNKDKIVYNIDDQFMFGKSMLISPVTETNAVDRKVYLPEGADWFDFWTGKNLKGGKTITADAEIDKIPLYVKAGSIIPFGPFQQYSTEKLSDPIEIRIYAGADAEFELFEDENDNYNYEKGIYSVIKFKWNENGRTLTLSDRRNEYPGMMKVRTFNIVIVGNNHGTGIEIENKIDKKIIYSGIELVTRF